MASQVASFHGITISARDREFLERSEARTAAINPATLKTIQIEPPKSTKQNEDKIAKRWMLYVIAPLSLKAYTWPSLTDFYSFQAKDPSRPRSVNRKTDLEEFMTFAVNGIKGRRGDDHYFKRRTNKDTSKQRVKKPVRGTARKSWNHFSGWCRRMGHPISPEYGTHDRGTIYVFPVLAFY
jgi:hypothetical protein